MSGDLTILNRQRGQPLNNAGVRSMMAAMLDELAPDANYDLTVHIVSTKAMTALMKPPWAHAGSTDVITFDYSGQPDGPLAGKSMSACMRQ